MRDKGDAKEESRQTAYEYKSISDYIGRRPVAGLIVEVLMFGFLALFACIPAGPTDYRIPFFWGSAGISAFFLVFLLISLMSRIRKRINCFAFKASLDELYEDFASARRVEGDLVRLGSTYLFVKKARYVYLLSDVTDVRKYIDQGKGGTPASLFPPYDAGKMFVEIRLKNKAKVKTCGVPQSDYEYADATVHALISLNVGISVIDE